MTRARPLTRLALAVLGAGALRADWKDEVGYTRLNQTFAGGVPAAVSTGVTQVEAGDASGNAYLPDSANNAFSGKTIANLSTGSGVSGHATAVGGYFYGNTASLVPGTTAIDAYNANGWLGLIPYSETRRVQNHSWIATGITTNIDATVAYYDARLDYLVQQTGAVCVVGVNNGYSTTLPQLLCQAYNHISVGLTNGQHSAGYTAYDGAGRIKPDLVAPETLTSYATPQVSSAAGLLAQKLADSYALSGAGIARTAKALLLAGATKESLSGWTRSATQPIDLRYGAGALNVFLSYRILLAGPVTASSSTVLPETAWANASVRSNTSSGNRTYLFDVPAGSSNARFSAALVWLRPVSAFAGSYTASTPADLNLALCSASGFTVGAAVTGGESTGAADNLEHLYLPDLPAGRYALVVSSASSTNTAYALAWRSSPAVTVAATTPVASEQTGAPGLFTVTRAGSVASPLLVPLVWGGTAVSGTHYQAPAATLLIPAGGASATVSVAPIADSLAQGDRTVTLSVAADFSLSAGSPASGTVTVRDRPYDAWRFARFSAAQLADSSVSGPSADPDGDGLSNLLEYALAADPLAADSAARQPVAGVASDGRLTLAYFQPADRTDLAYAVEWTADLAGGVWQTGAGYVTETARVAAVVGDAAGELVTVRADAAPDAAPRQFLRLRATR